MKKKYKESTGGGLMVPMSLAPSMESKPIREVAYETLKNAIVTGEIPAGSRIVETEYCLLYTSRCV